MRARFLSRRFAVTVAMVLGALVVGVAFANWAATGTGNSQAQAMTAQAITATTDVATADLYPGASGKIYFKLENPNPYPVTFTSFTPTGLTVDGSHSGCTVAVANGGGVHVYANSQTGLSIAVAANKTGANAVPANIGSALTMNNSAPDACQGATFTVAGTLSGSQS